MFRLEKKHCCSIKGLSERMEDSDWNIAVIGCKLTLQVNFDTTNALGVPKLTQLVRYTAEFIRSRFA